MRKARLGGLAGRLGDPNAAAFKIRSLTDAVLMLGELNLIKAAYDVVAELQRDYEDSLADYMVVDFDSRTSWKDYLDYCGNYDQLKNVLYFAVHKLKDALAVYDVHLEPEDDTEEPPYHGDDDQ